MNLFQRFSISIVIASLLLCGNAFAKPDDPPPIEVDVNVVNTPDVNVVNTPDVNVFNTPDVHPVEYWEDYITVEFRGSTDCPQSGCSWASASRPFGGEWPAEGKWLLIETITVTYSIGLSGDVFYPSTAAFQLISPEFTRHSVGEIIPTNGFTGADGMATRNIRVLMAQSIAAVVSFNETRPPADSQVSVSAFVSGRLIDAPPPPP